MTKKELTDIIRGIIREEVKEALPSLLLEVLSEKVTAPPTKKVVAEVAQRRETRTTVATESPRPIKKYSNNPVLNAILNETSGGVPPENGGPGVSADLSKLGFRGEVPSTTETVADTMLSHIPKEVIAENKEIQAVAGAFTRDYRSLIKAADAIAKKTYRP